MKEMDILLALKSRGYVTAGQLAAQLSLSEKTIRNIIQSLRPRLAGHGAQICSRPKLGYELDIIDEEQFLSFLHSMQDQPAETFESAQGRISFILQTFLTHCDEYIKLDDLSEQMHVSKSCINRDFREVKQLLAANHLKLESRPYYGLKIVGREQDLRACIARYQVHKNEACDEIVASHRWMLEKITDCMKRVLKKSDFQLGEMQFQNLTMHLFIALLRIKNGNYITFDPSEEELASRPEYQIARELRECIQEEMQLQIPEQETFYIAIHLAARKNIARLPGESSNIVVGEQVQRVVNRMIDHIDRTYALNLKEDIDLVMALYFHFVTLDVRLRYALDMSNPIVENIKQKYQLAFLIAQSCNEVIREFYPQSLNEDELAYIALHLELAMERRKQGCEGKDILIICATGNGTSRLLKYEYEKRFGHYVRNIYTADPSQLSSFDLDAVDYIFSTIQTDIPASKPVVFIHPILEQGDIETIAKVMATESNVSFFFRKELFFEHITARTPEAVIEEMVGRISRQEALPADFTEQIRKRERLGVTSFQTGVAFPHPNRPCTEHTFVAVGLLDRKIQWKSNRVRMVYLFSLAKEENREEQLPSLYQVTGELLSSGDRIQDIVEKRSYENFMRHILEIETGG